MIDQVELTTAEQPRPARCHFAPANHVAAFFLVEVWHSLPPVIGRLILPHSKERMFAGGRTCIDWGLIDEHGRQVNLLGM